MTDRISRREWLATASLAVAAARASARKPARIPLGFSLYGMGTLPLADAVSTCAKIGYDGVELALLPGYPSEPQKLSSDARKELRKRLADARLALHGLMENLPALGDDKTHAANLARLKSAAELAHALSPDAPPLLETILGGKPSEWDAVKAKLVDRLGAWADIAKQAKLVIAVKPHVRNALHDIAGVKWLLKQLDSPWIRLAFDYSHHSLIGESLEDAVKELIPFAVFVHVKDARGKPDKFEFLLPGTGGIDYARYANLLKQAKYAGPVVVEVSAQIFNKPGYDPRAAAKSSYDHLAMAFGGD